MKKYILTQINANLPPQKLADPPISVVQIILAETQDLRRCFICDHLRAICEYLRLEKDILDL